MALPQAKPTAKQAPAVFGSDAAPVIYFDGVYAAGNCNGIIQIEVAANELVPVGPGSPEIKVKCVATGHLRCSLPAAKQLRDMLDDAIKNLEAPARTENKVDPKKSN
jgi:hypothetical protein